MQFVRYHLPELVPETLAYAVEQNNTSDNLSYVLQLVKNFRKFPNVPVRN